LKFRYDYSIIELIMTAQEKLKTIEDISQKIASNFNPDKVILFGSHAWGSPDADSDVDLCIIKKTDNTRVLARQIDSLLFPRPFPIDVLVFRPDQMAARQNRGDFFVKDILTKGKVIYDRENGK
jgi:uncharacterized protein